MLETVFDYVLYQSFLATLFFSIAFSLYIATRKISHGRWLHFLWMSFFLILVIPFQWLSEFFFPKVSSIQLVKAVQESSPGPVVMNTIYDMTPGVLSILWLLGFFISMLLVLFLPMFQQKKFIAQLLLNSRVEDRWESEIQDVLGLGQRIQVYSSPEVQSPFVLGYFVPRVFLPKEALGRLSNKKILAVLLHEVAHIRNKDVRNIIFARAVISIFWFLPFSYYAYIKLREAQEYLADEFSLEQLGKGSYRVYGEALLDVAAGFSWSWESHLRIGVLGSSNLTRRLRMIQKLKDNKRLSLLLPLLVVIGFSIWATAHSFPSKGSDELVTIRATVVKDGKIRTKPVMMMKLGNEASILVYDEEKDRTKDSEIDYMVFHVKETQGRILIKGSHCISKAYTYLAEFKEGKYENISLENRFCTGDPRRFSVLTDYDRVARLTIGERVLEYSFIVEEGARTEHWLEKPERSSLLWKSK